MTMTLLSQHNRTVIGRATSVPPVPVLVVLMTAGVAWSQRRAGAGRPTGAMWRGKLVVTVPVEQSPSSSRPNRSLLIYDLATDHWTRLPVSEAPVQAAVYRDRLFVLGVPLSLV